MEYQRLTTVFDADESQLTKAFQEVDRGFSAAEKRAQDAVSRFDRITAGIGSALGKGISIGLGDVGEAVDSLTNITRGALASVPVVGTGLAAAFDEAQGAMKSAVATGFAYDDMMKRNRISIGLIARGANDATREIAGLRGISSSSEFGLPALVASARELQIMQDNARDVVPEIRAIGDAAAALGNGEAGLLSIANALARISEMGKVATRDARMLIRQGVPVFDILSEASGLSKTRAKRLLDSGRISANDFVDILLGDFQKRYKGAAAQMAETIAVQNAKLATGMAAIKGAAFQNLYDTTVRGEQDINKLIRGPQAGQIAAGVNAGAAPVTNLIQASLKALESGDLYGGALKAGESITEGLQKGISDKAGDAAEAAKDMGLAAVKALKDELGIQSPSKVFTDIGINAGEAFAQGLRTGGGSVGVRRWTQEQIEFAKKILEVAREVGATEKQIEAAFAAANVESRFNTLTRGDRNRQGVPQAFGPFQMWPSKGWGTQAQTLDPDYAIRKFFEVAQSRSQTGTPGQLAQRVEASAYPRRYDEQIGGALELLNRVRTGTDEFGSAVNEFDTAVRDLAASTNWRNRGEASPDEGRGRFSDLDPAQQLAVIRGLTGVGSQPGGDLTGGTGIFINHTTADPNAPILSGLQPVEQTFVDVTRKTKVFQQSLIPIPGVFEKIGDAAEGSGNQIGQAYDRAAKKLRGVRGELLELGITSKDISDEFESQFSSAFDHIGEQGHSFARDLALGMLQDIRHNVGVGIAGELRDAIFGTADGSKGGIIGKFGRLLGIGGKAAADAPAQTVSAAAVSVNTTATEVNTIAIQNLTAAMSLAGGSRLRSVGDFEKFFHSPGGAVQASGRLHSEADFENFFHESNANTAATVAGVRDLNTGIKAVDASVNRQGFLTYNSILDLQRTMVALQPQGPGLLGIALGAFVGALGQGIAGNLFKSDDSSDEGPSQPRPKTPPTLKRARGGPVPSWSPVILAEHGTEAVLFDRPGHVLNHNETRQLLNYNTTNNLNNLYPQEMKVRHSGSITVRESYLDQNKRGYSSPKPSIGRREVKEAILKYLMS